MSFNNALRIMLIGLVLFAPFCRADPISKEVQIKASLIKNFVHFTRWPNGKTTSTEKSKVLLCVVGHDPYSKIFDQFPNFNILGKNISANSIFEMTELNLVEQCDILFIRIDDEATIHKLVSTIKRLPILTISEIGKKDNLPAMIDFSYDEQSIGFSINQSNANLAGISFSSRMLRLAKNLEGHR